MHKNWALNSLFFHRLELHSNFESAGDTPTKVAAQASVALPARCGCCRARAQLKWACGACLRSFRTGRHRTQARTQRGSLPPDYGFRKSKAQTESDSSSPPSILFYLSESDTIIMVIRSKLTILHYLHYLYSCTY